MDVHAGFEETSRALFLRPELVNAVYEDLPPVPANTLVELFQVGKHPNWPGYIGSPRLATANYGAQLQKYRATRDIALALAILDGLDEREIPRYADFMLTDETLLNGLEGATEYEKHVEQKQRLWMKKKGIE